MFIDFLISLWVGLLNFLTQALPVSDGTSPGGDQSGGIPEVLWKAFGFFGFYLDISPFTVLMSVLSGLLIIFITWKALNSVFNFVTGLL